MNKVNLLACIVLVSMLFFSESGLALTDSRDVKDIGIDEKLGDTIPEDITIIDENNNPVPFKDLLSIDTPTVLNLVYYSCPKLCNFATDGLLQVVNETASLEIGKDYKLLTVSFD
ncbi:MAG: SCO family protein, partial [Thermodesulfobacteriota bacterium]